MLQRIREVLALLLLALLPFHALFITVATRVIFGPGHAPWGALALWKEGVIGVIVMLAIAEIVKMRKIGKIDAIDGLIVVLTAVLLGVSFALGVENSAMFYGFKYDLFAPLVFLVLRRVPWSQTFMTQVEDLLLWVGAIVAIYGIATFFLPQGFFTWLGYSDAHSLYQPDGPLAAFQQISDSTIRRVQGPMSGPNQMGLWLLIPLSVVLAKIGRARMENGQWKMVNGDWRWKNVFSTFYFPLSIAPLIGVALVLSFSRSSWIAAAIIACLTYCFIYRNVPRLTLKLVSLTSVLALLLVICAWLMPSVFVRRISLQGHIERPLQAIQTMIEHPFGLGLGSAGPAANRTHDPCVYLDAGADASWAAGNPALCVFSGDVQVQPADRVCSCALLPENWYLQIGVEAGWLGLTLFTVLIIVLLRKLRIASGELRKIPPSAIAHPQLVTFLAFTGISIAALFLHAWEDSAIAYSLWLLAASVLPSRTEK